MINSEKATENNIRQVAISRIRQYITHAGDGDTYFYGDFLGTYNNVYQSTEEAYRQALEAEIKWLESNPEVRIDRTRAHTKPQGIWESGLKMYGACPNCCGGVTNCINGVYKIDNYCPRCGQALRWG